MRTILIYALLCLCACSSEVEPVDGTPCKISVDSTWPANGSTSAHYRQDIEFYLSESVKDATWISESVKDATIVTDLEGTQWSRDEGKVIVFTPANDLEPNKSYEFGLSYCAGEPSIAFTTSGHGLQVAEPAELVGSTYSVDLSSIRFQAGGGVAEILLSIFDRSMLVQIIESTSEALSFRFAVAKNDTQYPEQDTCYRTLDQVDVSFSDNPLFSYTASNLQFDAFLAQLSLRDFTLEGSIAPDSLSLGGVSFAMTVDVRELIDVMGVDNYEEVCALAGSVGTECVTCPHEAVDACIDLVGSGLAASAINLDLLSIDVENSHEDCDKAEE